MKWKQLISFLIAEAILCVAGAFLLSSKTEIFSGIFAFPFEQIGMGLRALSLPGKIGNVFAWILYVAVSAAPLGYVAVRAKKRAIKIEDCLMAFFSLLLFGVLYLMINPGKMERHFYSLALTGMGTTFLGGTCWSIIVAYSALRLLRRFSSGDTQSWLADLATLIKLICAILVFTVFGAGIAGVRNQIAEFQAANTDGGPLLVSYTFIWIQYLVSTLPHIMEIIVLLFGIDLIVALSDNPYSGKTIIAARRTGKWCRISVVCILLSQVGLNLAQLLFANSIRFSRFTVTIPILSIIFVLAALLLCSYFEKGRALKDENDSFV